MRFISCKNRGAVKRNGCFLVKIPTQIEDLQNDTPKPKIEKKEPNKKDK